MQQPQQHHDDAQQHDANGQQQDFEQQHQPQAQPAEVAAPATFAETAAAVRAVNSAQKRVLTNMQLRKSLPRTERKQRQLAEAAEARLRVQKAAAAARARQKQAELQALRQKFNAAQEQVAQKQV